MLRDRMPLPCDAGRTVGLVNARFPQYIIHKLRSHWPRSLLCIRLSTRCDGNWAFSTAERCNWPRRGLRESQWLVNYFIPTEEKNRWQLGNSCPARRAERVIYSDFSGSRRAWFGEYNVISDIKTPNPSTYLRDLSYSTFSLAGIYLAPPDHTGQIVRICIGKTAENKCLSQCQDLRLLIAPASFNRRSHSVFVSNDLFYWTKIQ